MMQISSRETVIISKIEDLRAVIREWKKEGLNIGLVPTMGALHIGHESLIKKAVMESDRTVISIFVNPTQFGPNEDYNKYPRQLEKDRGLCSKNNVDIIFAPSPEEMYPEKDYLTMVVPPDFYKNKLCGLTRTCHFDGVVSVVLKLFNIVQPDKAYFGQKDAQQLIIIKKMCRDLNVPVQIVSCPIIRDEDGLACSSRNSYLTEKGRNKVLTLHKLLRKVEDLYEAGITCKKQVFSEALCLLDDDAELEYLEAYDSVTLESVDFLAINTLIAIAARIDNVRLIDNILLK